MILAKDKTCLMIDIADRAPATTLDCALGGFVTDSADALSAVRDVEERMVSLDLTGVSGIEDPVLEKLTEIANIVGMRRQRLHLRHADERICKMLNRLLLTEAFCLRDNHYQNCAEDCLHSDRHWQLDYFTLSPDLVNGRLARRRIDRLTEQMGYDDSFRSEVRIALGEAFTNAAEYGCKSPDSKILISCLATPDKLHVTVTDDGVGFDIDSLPKCDVETFCEHGRGVRCIEALMDDVGYECDNGTTLRMTKLVCQEPVEVGMSMSEV